MSGAFKILGSSSAGNCGLLKTGNTSVLIDAGFSARRIGQMLEAAGESLDAVDAVFLTHEHQDHSQGLRGLARRADLPVFANHDTADAVQARLQKRPNWQIFQTGSTFRFRDLEVRSFSVPHDAYDPVGFTFHWGEEGDLFSPPGSLAWVTDLGYVPELVRQRVSEVEILVIEANYDDDLLERDTRRPWPTKQRIRGRHGHLSNAAACEMLTGLNGSSALREVYLAHLSRDCNHVDRVRETFAGLCDGQTPFNVRVIDPESGTALATDSGRVVRGSTDEA